MTFFHFSLDTDYLDIVNKPNSLRPNLDWRLDEIKVGSVIEVRDPGVKKIDSRVSLRYQNSRYFESTYFESILREDMDFKLTELGVNPHDVRGLEVFPDFEWLSIEEFWTNRCLWLITDELNDFPEKKYRKLLIELSEHLDLLEWNPRRAGLQIIDFALKMFDQARHKDAFCIVNSVIKEIKYTDDDYFKDNYPEFTGLEFESLRDYMFTESFERTFVLMTSNLLLNIIAEYDNSEIGTPRASNIQRVVAYLKRQFLAETDMAQDVLHEMH